MAKRSMINLCVYGVPLYLYVEPRGRNLEQKPPQSRFYPKGKSPRRGRHFLGALGGGKTPLGRRTP